MSTVHNDDKIKRETITSGYIRLHTNTDDTLIPDSIITLCALFVSIWLPIPFKWNLFRGGTTGRTQTHINNRIKPSFKHIKINGSTLRDNFSASYIIPTVLANKLSRHEYNGYQWEITLKEWSKESRIRIGFIDMNIFYNIHLFDFHSQIDYNDKNQYVIGFDGGGKNFENTGLKDVDGRKYDFKTGDRICLCFDFETKKTTLYYNDREIGVVFKRISGEIMLAISLYFTEVKTSRFSGFFC